LNIRGNDIGDSGVKYLADALSMNKGITTLNLQLNQIGDSGMKDLSSSLVNNNVNLFVFIQISYLFIV
jgi:hypothetical protein